MSLRKYTHFVIEVFFFAWLANSTIAADGLFVMGGPNFLPLQVTVRNEAVIGSEQMRRTYVTTGAHMFAFIVPETFRIEASDSTKVVLVQADYNCFLTFRIIAPTPNREPESGLYRELLLGENPNAKILDEFSQTAGGHSGAAFDLQWINADQITQSARVVFVPSTIGIVKLTLLSQSDKFADSKRFFDYLRWSYSSDQEGPIKPLQTPKEPPRS